MTEKTKDVEEKRLLSFPDVFADFVNGVLFQGKQVVKPESLIPENPWSMYNAEGVSHAQERDVAMYWTDGNVKISLFGLENQSTIDKDMPLRILGYDGAGYRAQLLSTNKKPDVKQPRYPVISLVVYFGKKYWDPPLSLKECLKIPEGLQSKVSEYHMNLYQIAFLADEQLEMFQGDFREIAEFCVRRRRGEEYRPVKKELVHFLETVHTLMALGGNNSVEQKKWVDEFYQMKLEKGEKPAVDDFFTTMVEKGKAEGRAEEKEQGTLRSIRSLMETLHFTEEQALDALQVPEVERKKYKELLAQ